MTAAGEIKIQDVQNGLVDSMRRVDVQVEPLEHVVEGEKRRVISVAVWRGHGKSRRKESRESARCCRRYIRVHLLLLLLIREVSCRRCATSRFEWTVNVIIDRHHLGLLHNDTAIYKERINKSLIDKSANVVN